MIGERGGTIDRVILLEVDPDVIVRRLSGRRVCPKCNAVYNIDSIQTKIPGTCDVCGAAVIKRPDDEEETIRRRIDVYEEQTAPVISFYESRDNFTRIDGGAGLEVVAAELLQLVQ